MKHNVTPTSHSVPTAFIFLLIGLFALSSLTLTLIGTRLYRSVTASASKNSDSQLVLSYLGNRVRTFDSQGNVKLSARNGLSVLCLYEVLDGEQYETSIYEHNGAIWERYAPTTSAFDPEDGEQLVPARSLMFSMPSPQLLEATVVMADGATQTVRVALRSATAGGGAPQ